MIKVIKKNIHINQVNRILFEFYFLKTILSKNEMSMT